MPRLKEIPATTYVVSKHHVTLAEVPELAGSVLAPLEQAARAAGLEVAGPPTFFYRGQDGDMTKAFDFAMGFPVTGDGAPAAPYEVVEKAPFKCLAVDYVGAMDGISEAWGELYQDVMTAGQETADESREIYKKWVDFESEENVTELQAGIA